MTDPLDRPIWHALSTRQKAFAEGGALALRYAADVAPFAAAADDGETAHRDLAALIPGGGQVYLLQAEDCPPPPGIAVGLRADAFQMVAEKVAEPEGSFEVLGEADVPDMLALATLAKPGPFLARTHALGSFVGIRQSGRLVAMAGGRFSLPGHVEVSGVCTHPDFRGKGYAGLLSRAVAHRVMDRGDTPFLHAWASNTAAIRLYERLGFRQRRKMVVTVLGRP